MRHPKNSLMEDKMQTALTKTTGLRAKKEPSSEVAARTTSLRHRFKPRHDTTQTVTAVLEDPSPVVENPSPEEINAALESVTSHSQAPVEEPPTQVMIAVPSPHVEPPPSQPEEFSLSPAKPYLVAYMGKLRDARNILVYDLEQANKRLEKYRAVLQSAQQDVDSAGMSVLILGDNLEKIDMNLCECNKLDGMSLEIAPLLPTSSAHKKATHEPESLRERMTHTDPRLCRRIDVLALFTAEPHRNWTAKEVVDALPPVKRANGKQNVPSHLSVLTNDGNVSRVTKGVYTLAKQ